MGGKHDPTTSGKSRAAIDNDAPDPAPFEPYVEPAPGSRACIFASYKQWGKGQMLHVTKQNFGCPGGGHWLCGTTSKSREEYVKFLADVEGLKSTHELMNLLKFLFQELVQGQLSGLKIIRI